MLQRYVNGQLVDVPALEETAILQQQSDNNPANQIAPSNAETARARLDSDPALSAIVDAWTARFSQTRDATLDELSGTTPGL